MAIKDSRLEHLVGVFIEGVALIQNYTLDFALRDRCFEHLVRVFLEGVALIRNYSLSCMPTF